MSEMVLHQWEISPFCGKIRKILILKGLDWRAENYNGLRARKAASLSSVGKLPVLEDGEVVIQDSSKIAAYLEEEHPNPSLHPSDPTERARAHFLEDWADESLYWFEVYFRFAYPEAFEKAAGYLCEGRPAFEKGLFKMITAPIYKKKLAAQGVGRMSKEDVETTFRTHLDHLETLLHNRDWLAGETLSIADIAVSAQLDEMLRTSHFQNEILARKNINAWLVRNGEQTGRLNPKQ